MSGSCGAPYSSASRIARSSPARPLGATVHLVDDGVDTGPRIVQAVLRVEPSDAAEARRLLAPLEATLLRDVIASL